jgi:hypothetical protein
MKWYLVTGLTLSLFSCDADDARNIPSVVLNTLKEKFPNASSVEWDKEGSFYEAEFDGNTGEYTVEIDSLGQMKRVKIDIKDSLLPSTVRNSLDTSGKKIKISDVEILQLSGLSYYQVKYRIDGKKQAMVLDSTGTIRNEIKYWD